MSDKRSTLQISHKGKYYLTNESIRIGWGLDDLIYTLLVNNKDVVLQWIRARGAVYGSHFEQQHYEEIDQINPEDLEIELIKKD